MKDKFYDYYAMVRILRKAQAEGKLSSTYDLNLLEERLDSLQKIYHAAKF